MEEAVGRAFLAKVRTIKLRGTRGLGESGKHGWCSGEPEKHVEEVGLEKPAGAR